MLHWQTLDEKQNTKTNFYMYNNRGDVTLTTIKRETKYKNKLVHVQQYRRCYTDEH